MAEVSPCPNGNAEAAPECVFTVREIASEWKCSIDTVQRLFANEPDVFVIPADSGARRTGFRGEAEQRSGLIPNTIPG